MVKSELMCKGSVGEPHQHHSQLWGEPWKTKVHVLQVWRKKFSLTKIKEGKVQLNQKYTEKKLKLQLGDTHGFEVI